jgi:hypothetical protein
LWLDQQDIYGSVGCAPRLREAFAAALDRLAHDGVAATLARYTGGA